MYTNLAERNKIAIDFLKQGIPMDQISRFTGFTIEELTQIKSHIVWTN
jgi:hypothetical protein